MDPDQMKHLAFQTGHETFTFILFALIVVGLLYVALVEYVQYVDREVAAGRRKRPNSPYNDDDGPPPTMPMI